MSANEYKVVHIILQAMRAGFILWFTALFELICEKVSLSLKTCSRHFETVLKN